MQITDWGGEPDVTDKPDVTDQASWLESTVEYTGQQRTFGQHCVPTTGKRYHKQQRRHAVFPLQTVTDPTGREDLLAALRKALLLRLAGQLGCNKVAVGTSATRMAVRTVAMSAKGSGFALSGAIHFTDSRSVGQD